MELPAADTREALVRLLSELLHGTDGRGGFVLNRGDIGLLRSLDRLSAAEASQSVHGGATIAAHARHLSYGLSLMSEWAAEGGDPFANARWDEAWTTSAVDEHAWREIRAGLTVESQKWLEALKRPRSVALPELTGMLASIVHLAYHVGAIRQINKSTRGPTEGTF